jgi:orotidine-5'-phosphate decarboxylase
LNNAKERLIVALDTDTREKAEEWVHRLKLHVGLFKIGLQLFTKEGAELVRSIHKRGAGIFLDVKYHDIPTTVGLACEAACSLRVALINVHALGGAAMIKAAAQALKTASARMFVPKPRLLAVTVLTSHNQASLRREVGLSRTVKSEVLRLAVMAKKAGAEGVVCSPQEITAVRKACGKDFLIVTPGIRPAFAPKNDQQRTLTAGEAIAKGADYLVVGRPILAAPDPVAAAKSIVAEMQAALERR